MSYSDPFEEYSLSRRQITTRFVDPYQPYLFITKYDTDTIFLPDVSNFPLSDRQVLDDTTFSELLDVMLFHFNQLSDFNLCHMNLNKIEDFFLRVDLTTLKISMSIDTITQIINCLTSAEYNLIILPVRLDFLDIKPEYAYANANTNATGECCAHSNLVIIDKRWRTIEFFEPHGMALEHMYSSILNIQEIVENFLKGTFSLYDYSFVNIASTCPRGVQTVQGSTNPRAGHCLVWSLYFIMVRLMNVNFIPADKPVSQTANEIITQNTPESLDTTIRQFLAYIESLSIIPTRFMKSSNTYNITDFVMDTSAIENRLRYLLRTYILSPDLYKTDFKSAIDEIISYKTIPNFYTIFIQEISAKTNRPRL